MIRLLLSWLSGGFARPLWAVLAFLTNSEALWRRVSAEGIVVFVGPNGSGKSLAAVQSLLPTLRGIRWECSDTGHVHNRPYVEHAQSCAVCPLRFLARDRALSVAVTRCCEQGAQLLERCGQGDRLVYSTVELLGDDQEPHPRFVPLTDYGLLLSAEHADVLFDEVAGVSDASDSSSVPVQVVNWLHQLRKRDVRLLVTTPAYSRCSKPIRQVCTLVVDARSFLPELAESGRLWRPRRGFIFTAFDAFAFEDFTASLSRGDQSRSHARRVRQGRGVLWRPGCEAERRYQTLGSVLLLGHVTEAGLCSVCMGTRSRPRCGCDDSELAGLSPDQMVVQETVSGATRIRRGVPLSIADKGAASGVSTFGGSAQSGAAGRRRATVT